MCVWLVLLAAIAASAGFSNVSVVRLQLEFGTTQTIVINNTVQYILEFTPTGDQGLWPSRVSLSSDGGDTSRPLLVTARQRAGAVSWQLPYHTGTSLMYEMERTLCPDDSGDTGTEHCGNDMDLYNVGGFTLHVGSTCSSQINLSVRADPSRDWRLPFDLATRSVVTKTAPRVYHYRFLSEQDHVRLVVESEDDVCATVSVQTYACPIPMTLTEVSMSGLRMTVQRSGGTHLSRKQFPSGFYVVAIVHENDEVCSGEMEGDDEWLWSAAVLGSRDQYAQDLNRTKELLFTVLPALSRTQYWVAGSVTLIIFLLFYVSFGALVLAQRWPPFAKYVRPRAVLADAENTLQSQMDLGTAARRRRRDSDATFDSSDNSDSDADDPATPTVSHATGAVTSTATFVSVTNISLDDSPGAPTNDTVATISTADSPVTPGSDTDAANDTPVNAGQQAVGVVDGQQSEPVQNIVQPDHPAATADTANHANPPANASVADGAALNTPFGLPAQLNVAVLARHHSRVLRARSDRYLHTLYTVAVFYALPVVQFVAAFQLVLNLSGSLDICYYNFLCAHPAGSLSDFNHVFSNIGYLLLGALFMLQVHRRSNNRKKAPRNEAYGIPSHYGLLSALGAGMMAVALLSAGYHVCPNQLNFQFDTAFMYVLAVVSMVKIYQSRHPDVNARAHATFGVLAVLMALVVWGVLGGGPLFWGTFTVLHLFTFLLLSLRIYYVGQFRLGKESLAAAARGLRVTRPLYTARLVMLLIANAVNWLLALYGLFTLKTDFAGHLLEVLLGNTLLYMVFYLSMKLMHGERPRWYAWAFTAGAAAAWAPALYFFVSGSSDWSATAARSRHKNHECRVLRFYDAHDLWHMLSAVALYLSFNAMLTWDDGLAAVKRTDIAVF